MSGGPARRPAPNLSRELLAAGGMETLIRRDAPDARILTEDERRASLAAILALRPPGDVWLFGYGSLIWNPALRSVEQRNARVQGWSRRFCLATTTGRGSPDQPGLVLALDEGGACDGVAFRIAETDLESELPLVWRREMVLGSYAPRWVDLLDEAGARFGAAIAFTIDKAGDHYVGELPLGAVVERLATASGSLGSAADYLFRTRDGLRANGIPDPHIEDLAERVAAMSPGRPR